MKTKLAPLWLLIIILLSWQLCIFFKIFSSYILPSPKEVSYYLWTVIIDGSLLKAFWVTISRLFIGYLISLLIGIPCGYLCARKSIISGTIGLLATSAQALPSVCWVPFALLAFGQSESAMLFVVIMGSVGSIILAAESSIKHVPKTYIEAAQTMGSKGLHTALHVLLPASLPEFCIGMKQGWAFAWRSLMAAEIYVSVLSGVGLGQLLHYGRELHAMEQVVGIIFVILFVGLSLDRLIFIPIQNRFHERRGI